MTELPVVTCTVDVAVDPKTAFVAFTDEMDHWWMRTPISYYDSARAIARRCETGVGGRLLEVYDDATGEALELGVITVWEPGARLQWRSSVDDVEVDVHFTPIAAGTNVEVHARVLPGGNPDVTGSFSFVRTVPDWFVKWCGRRDTASRDVQEQSRLNLALYYRRPVTAARWLAQAFGFEPPVLPADGEDMPWIEFRIGTGSVLVFRLADDAADGRASGVNHMTWVFVDDLDAHYTQAEAAGARIVEPIHQHGYRAYVAEDLEGHRWTFAQARPTMVP
jgi:uncharacterized glyoxalase superfamily protein PhnB